MKYLKYFESNTHIGETITFVARHKEIGHEFGSGFVVSKKTLNNKFVGNISCTKGTEITGVVIDYVNAVGLGAYWRVRLPENNFVNLYTDFFDIKS